MKANHCAEKSSSNSGFSLSRLVDHGMTSWCKGNYYVRFDSDASSVRISFMLASPSLKQYLGSCSGTLKKKFEDLNGSKFKKSLVPHEIDAALIGQSRPK